MDPSNFRYVCVISNKKWLDVISSTQECIPVGCVLPSCNHTAGGSPQTETPRTETSLPDRDPPDRDPRTETSLPDRDPRTETPGQRPPSPRQRPSLDRDPPRTETPPVNRITDRCKNITLPQLRC